MGTFINQIIATHYDLRGNILFQKSANANSILLNLFHFFANAMGQQTVNALDTGGASRTLTTVGGGNFSALFNCNADNTEDTFGIQVGTGTDAVLIGNNALATKIAHGSTPSTLYYLSNNPTRACFTNDTETFCLINRGFINKSGGSITIQEIGLVCVGYYASTKAYFLVDRTLFETTVANNSVVGITYKIGYQY